MKKPLASRAACVPLLSVLAAGSAAARHDPHPLDRPDAQSPAESFAQSPPQSRSQPIGAPEDSAPGETPMPAPQTVSGKGETVVIATRSEHEVFDLPVSVTVADQELIERRNNVVALDALSEKIGIGVEKRNGVSSDPVVRGFSGANILALVDGNSLTTLWGEGGYAGDDMYGKVDGASVERIEVIRGPSSVLYGSNALGGVINFVTRRPPEYTPSGATFGGSLATSFWGATDGVMTRLDAYGASERFRYRLGYTMRDIGDTRGGGDLGLLEPSGVDESNVDWNSEVRLNDSDTLELNAQLVNRNGLTKYFRPTQTNDNDRLGVSLRWHSTDVSFGEEASLTAYYQKKEDRRYYVGQAKEGVAKWDTFSTDFQSTATPTDDHLLTWGLHYAVDFAESGDDEQFTITTPALGEQKASPDTIWQNLGAYLHDEWELDRRWTLTGALRADYFHFEADDNVFWTIPGSTAPENIPQVEPDSDEHLEFSGGLGVSSEVTRDCTVYGSWGRGFHLFPPGFGLRQVGYGVLAPTDGFLDPSRGDQLEIGTRVDRSWWSIAAAAYYTFLTGVQQPVPGSYNGLTQIDIDGNGTIDPDEQIYVVDAGADGFVTGLEIDTSIDLAHFSGRLEGWSWYNGFLLNEGDVELDTGTEPLRHTLPPRWLSALRWEDSDARRGAWFEFVADVVGRYDDVAASRLASDPGYLADPQDPASGLLAPYGLPSYQVFHARMGLNLTEHVQLTLGVENLFDVEYRTAHSRMDAAGRNVMIGVRASF